MSDRELLEAAAKAAGVEGQYVATKEVDSERWGILTFMGYGHVSIWNPLTDDGDALRLAGSLGEPLSIDITTAGVTIVSGFGFDLHEPHNADPMAATRRAIVRAAAALPPPPQIEGFSGGS